MGLRLRIYDTQGTQELEIEPGDLENPSVIGSSSAAAVQIALTGVAPSHCQIYSYSGRWVVQDCDSPGGTFLNGQALTQPAYLSNGDRIGLGRGPGTPVIDVEPLATDAPRMVARPASPLVAEDRAINGEPPASLVAADEWGVSWLGTAAGRPRTARRGANTTNKVIAALVLAAGVVLLVGWITFNWPDWSQPAPNPPQEAYRPPRNSSARQKRSIFDFPSEQKNQGLNRTVPPSASDTLQQPLIATQDTQKDSDEWREVELIAAGTDAGKALLRIADYRQRNGQSQDLQKLEERAMDRIWWERIQNLCQRRDLLQGQIQELARQITDETEFEYRRKLEMEKLESQQLKQAVIDTLTQDMGYVSAEVPNSFDDVQIGTLRVHRNVIKYDVWKNRVLESVIRRRCLPWE